MLFKEAVSKRILELCSINGITPNRLAEMSTVALSTLRDIISYKVNNPSSYVIYQLSKVLKFSIMEFFDSNLFNQDNIKD